MSQTPTPQTRAYGPEYEIEAIRRLEAGYPIGYERDGVVTREYPDGRRFEVVLDPDYTLREVRELPPATR